MQSKKSSKNRKRPEISRTTTKIMVKTMYKTIKFKKRMTVKIVPKKVLKKRKIKGTKRKGFIIKRRNNR